MTEVSDKNNVYFICFHYVSGITVRYKIDSNTSISYINQNKFPLHTEIKHASTHCLCLGAIELFLKINIDYVAVFESRIISYLKSYSVELESSMTNLIYSPDTDVFKLAVYKYHKLCTNST